VKIIYCLTINTSGALALIRKYEGDVERFKAILCHYVREESSRDKFGNLMQNAYDLSQWAGHLLQSEQGYFPRLVVR
jgi:hypothetical protein